MAQKKIHQATESFYIGRVLINRGDTFEAGHALLKGLTRSPLLREFKPTYSGDDEPPTEPTPEPEPAPEPEPESDKPA